MTQDKLQQVQIDVALINQTLSRLPQLEEEITKLNNRLFWYNGAMALLGVAFPVILSALFFVGNSWREAKDNNDIQMQHQMAIIENRVAKLEFKTGLQVSHE